MQEPQTISAAHFPEQRFEKPPRGRASKASPAPITTEQDELQISASPRAHKPLRHRAEDKPQEPGFALTAYDMIKAPDRSVVIREIRPKAKPGGKNGDFQGGTGRDE